MTLKYLHSASRMFRSGNYIKPSQSLLYEKSIRKWENSFDPHWHSKYDGGSCTKRSSRAVYIWSTQGEISNTTEQSRIETPKNNQSHSFSNHGCHGFVIPTLVSIEPSTEYVWFQMIVSFNIKLNIDTYFHFPINTNSKLEQNVVLRH
jgi:hypothetical protein